VPAGGTAGQALTKIDSTNYNTQWQTISAGGALPADTVVAAGTRIISNKLVGTDAQPSWQVLGSGQMNFGPGGAGATDTTLFRNAASDLKTGSIFRAGGSIVAMDGTSTQVTLTYPNGVAGVTFGNAQDTNLYRSAANALKTDGSFSAAGPYFMTGSPGGQGAGVRYISGAGGATSWYLNAATGGIVYFAIGEATYMTVSTSGITTPTDFTARAGASSQIQLADNGSGAATIWFGTGATDYIYHPSAGSLQTNCQFVTAQGVTATNDITARSGANSVTIGAIGPGYGMLIAGDTNLFRISPGGLGTNVPAGGVGLTFVTRDASSEYAQRTRVSGDTYPRFVWDGNGIHAWGSGGNPPDTNLYRYAGGYLATGGYFIAGHGIFVGNGQQGTGSGDGINFGSSNDTNLYRSATGQLRTDGIFLAGQRIDANIGGAETVSLTVFGAGKPGINLQSDTALYRNGANTIACFSSTWGTLQAAAFSVQSDRRTKAEIEMATPLYERLLRAGVYSYRRDKSAARHVGLMADELPEAVLSPASTPDGERGFVDIYKLCAVLVQTVQHLNERLVALEAS